MLKDYARVKQIESLQYKSYKVLKDNKHFYLKEYQSLSVYDEQAYKFRKQVNKLNHVVNLVDQFEQDKKKYFVSQYIQDTIQSIMDAKPDKVFELSEALHYFMEIIDAIRQFHVEKILLKVFYPNKIRVREGKIYLQDFSQAFAMKRRKRIYSDQRNPFISPQYLYDDGFGYEADIWAAGVLLYYMINGHYPFQINNQSQMELEKQFQTTVSKGFTFNNNIKMFGKFGQYRQDFFKKIFNMDKKVRMSIHQISSQPFVKAVFDKVEQLDFIWQNQQDRSIFSSKFTNHSHIIKFLHREEVILDFIEKSSECLSLECPNIYNQSIRMRVHNAVMKLALIKCTNLIDILLGKTKLPFQIDTVQWQKEKSGPAFQQAKKKFQQKYKILLASFKGSKIQIENNEGNLLFEDVIPKSFQQIKKPYRKQLSEMYLLGRLSLKSLKNREQRRRLIESLVRIVIFYLSNRLFNTDEQMRQDFASYFKWSQIGDLQDLDEWILNQNIHQLEEFVRIVTNKYLGKKEQ